MENDISLFERNALSERKVTVHLANVLIVDALKGVCDQIP